MAATVTRSRYNIFGDAGGKPNPVLYFGPDLDLTAGTSPITSANTLKVWRYDTDGTAQSYVPGGGSNDFTTMDAGVLGLGRLYVIIAKADFLLPNSNPGA